MKLALIAYLHGSGGAERQIVLLANEMSARGHETHLVVLCDNKSQYKIESSVIVHDLSIQERTGQFRIQKRYSLFKKEMQGIRPDITINYNLQGAYFSLLAGRKVCGKILYSERGDPYDSEYAGLLGMVRDITCKHLDAFVFQSEGAKTFFHLSPKQKAVVIHNSVVVPQDKYPIPSARDNRIVTVGRLHPQKNPYLLVDTFALIADKYPDVTLEFYGDGGLKEKIQAKINAMGLAKRVYLNASRKDIFDCIRTARLFVLTSDYEGMPNALMEAMALGLPCISTDCRPGGARTLIENGKNGIIVPTRNANALAEKMIYLLDHPQEAERMAQEAYKIGETHTNEVTFDKWNQFLFNI